MPARPIRHLEQVRLSSQSGLKLHKQTLLLSRLHEASNDSLADSESTPSKTETGNKQRVVQVCFFWKQGHCKKGKQCRYDHTDIVQAKYRPSAQHSAPSSSASSDDGDVFNVTLQEEQPRDDETYIDNMGEDMTLEDVEEQPLQQGDLSSTDSEQVASDVSEKDATDTSTEVLYLANDEQNDGNEESKQVEPSIGDVVDQRLYTNHVRDEVAPVRQTGPEKDTENVALTGQLEEDGNRSLETITPDGHVCRGDLATLDTIQITAEHDGQDEVLVQSQQEGDANDNDHVPHWTEYADPYANPFVGFCKFFARGWCKQNMDCTYRHALTVQEYLLLFRVEPVIWSQHEQPQYVQSKHSDPPKHPTSLARGPCLFYPLGKCHNGDKCPYTHDPADCISKYVENNQEESGPSYNGNEQTDWSSRQRRPCKYFMNYGSCRNGEYCEFSHNINDLNTNLVNNVESQENERNFWDQTENVDWGTENNSLTNEGHRPEWGINDGNAKDRPADEEELNGQNVDDKELGGQWADDNAAATQWGDDNAAATQWGDDNAAATQWGDDNAAATQWGDDNAAATQWGDDNAAATQWGDDNAAATQWGDDNAAATRWGDNNSAMPERSHDNESRPSRNGSRQSEQGDRTIKTCKFFALGTCQKAACPFVHQRSDFARKDRGGNVTNVTQHNTWNTSSNGQKAWQSEGEIYTTSMKDEHRVHVSANDGWKDGNIESDRTLQSNGQKICRYFMQGRCSQSNCKFSHGIKEPTNSNTNWNTRDNQRNALDNPESEGQDPNEASWNDNWLEANFSSSYEYSSPRQRRRELCMYFGQGFCRMGANCPMLHVNPDELDEGEVQEEPEKQGQELHYDADNQTERSIFNCTVAFGAGCRISHTLTATDPTQIILSGLPPSFSPEELNNIDIDGLRGVHLDGSRAVISGILEFESPQDTLRSLHRLHGYVLRKSTLSAHIGHAIESEKDSKLYGVMITWPSPSKIAWARYPSVTLAKDDANRLDGQMFDGRKVQASYIPAKKGQVNMFAVQISNLPPESSGESIAQLCNGCQFVNMTSPTYTTSPVEHIKELLTRHGNLVDFDPPDLPPCKELFLAFARFSRSEDAAAAIAAFHKLKDGSLGANGSFKSEAVNHVRFTIPSNQFQYIREDLEKLRDSHQQQCSIFFVRSTINVDNMDIYAFAPVNDSPAFMKLLTSLNSLVNGEVLKQDGNTVWDDYFHMSSSAKAIEMVNMEHLQQYSVLVMPDRRTQQIIIHGELLNRPRAKDYILKLIKKVRVAWNDVPLERTFVRWYLEQGQDQIQSDSDIGQNKVSVDLTVPKLVVRGDTKVLTKVKEYIRAAVMIPESPSNLAYDDVCHICTQKAISPIRLPCKHCYCKECLTALLSYAVESHSMPLKCIATDVAVDSNQAPCSKDIPYPVIRDLLPMAVEEQLLRSRFLSHVRSDAKPLFFCPTPNCETVHRYREGGALLRCPACLSEVCSSCQTRSHPGTACKEWLESIDRI